MSKLKILREVNNYTQEFIAEALGLDQSTYSKLERNPKKLKAEQVEKLAEIYEVGVADILSSDLMISFTHNEIDKGYVHNNYNDNKDVYEKLVKSKDAEIAVLREQIDGLKKLNEQLSRLLESKL